MRYIALFILLLHPQAEIKLSVHDEGVVRSALHEMWTTEVTMAIANRQRAQLSDKLRDLLKAYCPCGKDADLSLMLRTVQIEQLPPKERKLATAMLVNARTAAEALDAGAAALHDQENFLVNEIQILLVENDRSARIDDYKFDFVQFAFVPLGKDEVRFDARTEIRAYLARYRKEMDEKIKVEAERAKRRK